MKLSRLETAIIISMVGYLADFSITQWMLYGLTGYAESNMNLMPQVGLPLLVLNFILADRILPRVATYDRVIYTMSLLQWTGPIQNVLVLFNVVNGLSFAVVLPFMGIIYVMLHFAPVVGNRLKFVSQLFG